LALAPVSASTQEALIRKAGEGKERSRARLRPVSRSTDRKTHRRGPQAAKLADLTILRIEARKPFAVRRR
jgi:hypothetical protein